MKLEIARKKQEAEKNQAEEVKVVSVAPTLLTPVTQEIFENTWRDYLMLLQEDKRMSLHAILNNAKWELLNDKTVELTLASQHENEMFDEERINVIPFFRSNLKNTAFDISIKVVNSIIYKRAFTAEEKFNAMAEKNPVLNDLRKLFALDLE